MSGRLTLQGIEKPVVMRLKFNGIKMNGHGEKQFGFIGTIKINPEDFGLEDAALFEELRWELDEEVIIQFEIEGILQK